MSMWGQLGFQDASSPIMTMLISFHDHAMLILTLVMTFVLYMMAYLMLNKATCRNIIDAQGIEIIWTLLPTVILLFLAFPSLRLLYLMDEMSDPIFSLKAIGHQWYWTYQYADFFNLEFDSYMLPTNELNEGDYRLLEVDNRAVIPMNLDIRVLITAADVIHSWAVPSLGVKLDAIPGRLNQMNFSISRPGIYYGQCSEICGANHSFMPISLEAVSFKSFTKWLSSYGEIM